MTSDNAFFGQKTENNVKVKVTWAHSRMRGQSLGLVTAADKIPAIGVLFAVDYDVIVRKPCFQRGTTHVFLKNFRSFLFKFFGQRHGVLILLQPIRIGPCSGGGRSIFRSIPGIFFCLFWRHAFTHAHRKMADFVMFWYVLLLVVASYAPSTIGRKSTYWSIFGVIE